MVRTFVVRTRKDYFLSGRVACVIENKVSHNLVHTAATFSNIKKDNVILCNKGNTQY